MERSSPSIYRDVHGISYLEVSQYVKTKIYGQTKVEKQGRIS